VTSCERGFLSRDDDADEEVLRASLAAAMSAGDDDRIRLLRELLADPQRARKREFREEYARHLRHREARRMHHEDGE
jgi:putative ubiquitin-RnfH superfamily antitoxin RatB of RatAB toxin-antitoxin module